MSTLSLGNSEGNQRLIIIIKKCYEFARCRNSIRFHEVIFTFQDQFKLKGLSSLKFFIGLEVARSSKEISLCQRKYFPVIHAEAGALGPRALKGTYVQTIL